MLIPRELRSPNGCTEGAVDVPVTFYLMRSADCSRVSGVGVVADGVAFPNGKVALAWRSATPSVAVYESVDDVVAIHGHDGATELVPYDMLWPPP